MKIERFTPHGSFRSTTSNGRTGFRPGFFSCGHTLTTRMSGSNFYRTAAQTARNGFLLGGETPPHLRLATLNEDHPHAPSPRRPQPVHRRGK
jgi:hypothetical protein